MRRISSQYPTCISVCAQVGHSGSRCASKNEGSQVTSRRSEVAGHKSQVAAEGHLLAAIGERGFGLQAEVLFFRAFGSTHGGLEATVAAESKGPWELLGRVQILAGVFLQPGPEGDILLLGKLVAHGRGCVS